jgi:hypothetical protein
LLWRSGLRHSLCIHRLNEERTGSARALGYGRECTESIRQLPVKPGSASPPRRIDMANLTARKALCSERRNLLLLFDHFDLGGRRHKSVEIIFVAFARVYFISPDTSSARVVLPSTAADTTEAPIATMQYASTQPHAVSGLATCCHTVRCCLARSTADDIAVCRSPPAHRLRGCCSVFATEYSSGIGIEMLLHYTKYWWHLAWRQMSSCVMWSLCQLLFVTVDSRWWHPLISLFGVWCVNMNCSFRK